MPATTPGTHPDVPTEPQAGVERVEPAGDDATGALEKVVELEMKLLDPNMREDVEGVQAMLHEYYSEFSPTGQVYNRDNVVLAPVDDAAHALTVDRLEAELLAPGTVLVTYRAHRSQRASWRSSLWLSGADGWRLRHHQTTPIRID